MQEFKITTKRTEFGPEWVKSETKEDYTLYITKWVHEQYKECLLGWVELEGRRWRAGHPVMYDEQTDSDALDLGYFNTKEEAMKAVEESNPPYYSNYYI